MKQVEKVFAFLGKMSNKILGKIPLFKDSILAISNLTRTLNDVVKAYTQLAKMVIEDRDAINDLYQLHAELQDERLRQVGSSQQQKTAQAQAQARETNLARVNTDWAESNNKKKMSN